MKYRISIPFMNGISIKIKRDLAISMPIIQKLSIFKLIRTEIEKINQLTTSGIHNIKFKDSERKEGVNRGMTKRKIEERVKQRETDSRLNKNLTAISRLNSKSLIEINFNDFEKKL